MARGRKGRWKDVRKRIDYDKKEKAELYSKDCKDIEERPTLNVNCIFKSEELQEICNLLGINELEDQHTMIGAVVIGKFNVVKRMLRDGYSINNFQNGVTPIMAAVKSFRLDMVYFLMQKGADISLEDKEGNNIILLALQCVLWDQDSFLDFLSSVKDNKNFNPNHCNVLGYTSLHYAVKRQWKGALEMLLTNKACPNCVTKKGVTPLMVASSRCDTDAVKILLTCQAVVCCEDQRGCTALCYAIAFMIQKHLDSPNACLELLVAAVNDEHSDMTLESYLKRRLDLMINPPVPMYSEIIKTVSVNIISFFTRFIQAGLSMLLDLNVFKKVSEAIMYHINDVDYIKAMLGVIAELVRYCDCCFLCSSQEQIADAFFQAGGEKACLHILDRYGAEKSDLLKSALLPFFFTCTSRSYTARSWLENNYKLVKPYYTKYVRSSMITFPGCVNVSHLRIFKKCITDFQTLMDVLQNYGIIITEKEKAAERKRREEIKSKVNLKSLSKQLFSDNYKKRENIDLHYRHNNTNMLHKYKQGDKTYNSKEEIGINDVRTINILEPTYSESNFLKYRNSNIIKESCNNLSLNSSEEQLRKKDLINKYVKQIDVSEYTPTIKLENIFVKENINMTQDMFISELENIIDNAESDLQNDINTENRFQDGFNLFQLDEISGEQVNYSAETNCYINKSKTVSDKDLEAVLNYLESIFNNILVRYESTWQKQWQQGYLDAQGNVEDILKLMKSLPDLEACQIKRMTDKWKRIKNIIKENARKDYNTYISAVMNITNHLLQFEENLEAQHIKIYDSKVIYPNVELNLNSVNNKNKRENILFEDTHDKLSLKNTNTEHFNVNIDSTDEKRNGDNENPPKKIDVDSIEYNSTTKEKNHTKSEWIWEDLSNNEESVSQRSNKNVGTSDSSDPIKTLLLSSDIPVTTKLEMINELSALYDEDTTIDALYKSPKFSNLVTKLLSTDIKDCEIFGNGLLSMADQNKQNDFKLFNGGNFGNLELGLDNRGRPVVVKKFIKQGNQSTNLISMTLKSLVTSMLRIRNEYILPYMICLEVDNLLLIATPLCINNLGEYIPYLCQTHTLHLHALSLVKQIMYGLHYLHTLDKPIVHGNLKPSNILIDGNGTPRLADFGLQEVLYQQIGPVCSSIIWWSRESFETFNIKWKLMCSEKGDIQSAGMIAHYILSGGFHPFGTLPESIIENLQNGWISLRTNDSIANDLLYWMLSYFADDRPSISNVLTHVCLWDSTKRWEFLLACCGISQNGKEILFRDSMHADIDKIAKQHNINSEWVSVMKNHFSVWISGNEYTDTLSGFFQFMRETVKECSDLVPLKEFILEVFPLLPLNIFRLLQETEWINHPIFTQYREIN